MEQFGASIPPVLNLARSASISWDSTFDGVGYEIISVGLRRSASGLERIVPRIEKVSGDGWFDHMTISPIVIG